VTRKRAGYGHRGVGARVNRLFRVRYDRKRIRRGKRMHDLQIPAEIHASEGSPCIGAPACLP